KTLAGLSKGIYKDRGSRFLAFAYPVSSEEEIKRILHTLKKKYHDARHLCYAYRLGTEKEIYRTNDDGEPSNSAGKPILDQIMAYDLMNVLIVVVRYFGGTLLGVGGLINAYRSAAMDALANARVLTKTINDIYELQFGYPSMNDVKKVIKEEKLTQVEQKFDSTCSITISVRKSRSKNVIERLGRIDGLRIRYLRSG
ncbi:MAG: YigZ family protein, partial [Bacteroidetes bacterium]|nr:YigZ family protein [Bacteroidota bacterium]